MREMTVGSLFSGIGGIDLGFEQAGFSVKWANELDVDACMVYRQNFPKIDLFQADISTLDPTKIPRVSVLTAGFPCQPFSVCGNKKGFDDRRGNMFFEIMRFADSMDYPILFLENVANLAEHDKGRTFQVIYSELSTRGYYIRYVITDACNHGVPQHRTRIYIVAFREYEQACAFRFPEESRTRRQIFDVIDRTVRAPDNYYLSSESRDYDRMKKAIQDKNQIYRFSDYGIQVSKDGVSFTLKANMGTWYNRVPIICDDYGIRKITLRECLALQGFPDAFTFPEIPIKSAYRQCGNTVCVPVVRKIAEQIMRVIST